MIKKGIKAAQLCLELGSQKGLIVDSQPARAHKSLPVELAALKRSFTFRIPDTSSVLTPDEMLSFKCVLSALQRMMAAFLSS